MTPLVGLLEATRRKLAQTGARSRLIHVNRNTRRINALNIINERSDDIFKILRADSKKMGFLAKGVEEDEHYEGDVTLGLEDEEFDECRYTDSFLETPLTQDTLQKRLLKLSGNARTAEEEQGINILYLNLGFLQWYENKNSETLREAPLILLPVELTRKVRSSTYEIKCRDDDIATNLPLQERLEKDFGITLPEIEDNDDFIPSNYFQKVSTAISGQRRWTLDQDGMQLGFFSFAKLLMFRDLDPSNWNNQSLTNNPLVRKLLADGFESEPPLFGTEDRLDEVLEPNQILHVVDADSSQTKVIEEVRAGRSLIVQGPPGTGKSQTITNILAAAAYDNKKVLFVAEKMAALEVVYTRMVKAGLRDLCLELHSRNTNKKAFLKELNRTLSEVRTAQKTTDNSHQLKQSRDELNRLTALLHNPVEDLGRTPFEVLSALIDFAGRNVSPPQLKYSHLVNISREKEQSICQLITRYDQWLSNHGPEQLHPFRGVTNLDLQPIGLQRLLQKLRAAIAALEQWSQFGNALHSNLDKQKPTNLKDTKSLSKIVDLLQNAPPETLEVLECCYSNIRNSQFREAIATASEWVALKNHLGEIFLETVWSQQVSHLRTHFLMGTQSWLARISGKYKSASRELAALLKGALPETPLDRLELLDTLIEAQAKQKDYENEARYLATHLQELWRGERTNLKAAQNCISWLTQDDFALLGFSVQELNGLINNPGLTKLDYQSCSEIEKALSESMAKVVDILQFENFSMDSFESADLEAWMQQFSEMVSHPEEYEVWIEFERTRCQLRNHGLQDLFEFVAVRQLIKEYNQWLSNHGPEQLHPFRGVTNLDLQPIGLQRLLQKLRAAIAALEQWSQFGNALHSNLDKQKPTNLKDTKSLSKIVDLLQNAPPETLEVLECCYSNIRNSQFREAIATASEWVALKNHLGEIFLETVWSQQVSHLRTHFLMGTQSWLARISGKYKSASRELAALLKGALPETPLDRLELLDTLIEAQAKQKDYENEARYLATHLQELWRGERTNLKAAQNCISWLTQDDFALLGFSVQELNGLINNPGLTKLDYQSCSEIEKALSESMAKVVDILQFENFSMDSFESADLEAWMQQFSEMVSHPEEYEVWIEFERTRCQLRNHGLQDFFEFTAVEGTSPGCMLDEFLYTLNEERWNRMLERCPELNSISQIDRHKIVEKFQTYDTCRLEEVQRLIRFHHLSQVPQGADGEMKFILGEIAKKRNHRSIRQMMQASGSTIQSIKPVFLMSPISVAQFLPPEKLKFDLLVIDEASQVRPEDALGCVARTHQIVVVGDQKQLPPTSFFERLTDDSETSSDEDEEVPLTARATEMESILSLCEARGLKQSMLEWHYRSRDPSLITVSNREFYNNQLILPPSPLGSSGLRGLSLQKVPGVYSNTNHGGGRPGTNLIEATRIVDRLREITQTRPKFSVGVVTFSKAQADMVTQIVELNRRTDAIFDQHLRNNKSENIFVKNIENVQGDERDIILISVGYGPHKPNGRLASMNFGPINSDGGERRLNVLFSRSRVACEVFVSFDPSEINLSRAKKAGPRILKQFLEFAETGQLKEIFSTSEEADSLFEEDVAREIRALGYQADHQVGTAGFKIDLGIRGSENHEHYILAVECDGAIYHSALWARERDRHRQQILEDLGWSFHRIWSTDWYHRRTFEIDRLKKALETAESRDVNQSIKGCHEVRLEPSQEQPEIDRKNLDLSVNETSIPKYEKAHIQVDSSYAPHKLPVSQIAQLVVQIVKTEGLIHVDEIARRYANAYLRSTAGSRIKRAVKKGLLLARANKEILDSENFWGTNEQFSSPQVRDRNQETGSLRDPQYLAKEEIRACADLIRKDSGHVEMETLIKSVSRLFGFKRTGPNVQNRIKKALDGHSK